MSMSPNRKRLPLEPTGAGPEAGQQKRRRQTQSRTDPGDGPADETTSEGVTDSAGSRPRQMGRLGSVPGGERM